MIIRVFGFRDGKPIVGFEFDEQGRTTKGKFFATPQHCFDESLKNLESGECDKIEITKVKPE